MLSNMTKLFAFTMFISVYSFAQNTVQNNDRLVQEISELSRTIRAESASTDIAREQLVEAKILLEDALEALRSKTNGKQVCFKFAYEKYYSSNSSETATNKAVEACKTITDVDVAKYAYGKYYSANSAETAMNKSAELSSRPMQGKLDMLEYAYGKYYSSNSAETAISKAGAGVAKVRRGSKECLTDLFTRYYSSNSSEVAMNKAIEGCSK